MVKLVWKYSHNNCCKQKLVWNFGAMGWAIEIAELAQHLRVCTLYMCGYTLMLHTLESHLNCLFSCSFLALCLAVPCQHYASRFCFPTISSHEAIAILQFPEKNPNSILTEQNKTNDQTQRADIFLRMCLFIYVCVKFDCISRKRAIDNCFNYLLFCVYACTISRHS